MRMSLNNKGLTDKYDTKEFVYEQEGYKLLRYVQDVTEQPEELYFGEIVNPYFAFFC